MSVYTTSLSVTLGGEQPIVSVFELDQDEWEYRQIGGRDTWVGAPNSSMDDIPPKKTDSCYCECEVRGHWMRHDCECDRSGTCHLSGTDDKGPYECYGTCQ